MIRHLILDQANFDGFELIPELNYAHTLPRLGKINLLVGPNNSGKSRFLRRVISADDFRFIPKLDDATVDQFPSTFEYKGVEKFVNQHCEGGSSSDDTPLMADLLAETGAQSIHEGICEIRWARAYQFLVDHLTGLNSGSPIRANGAKSNVHAWVGNIQSAFQTNEREPADFDSNYNRLYIPQLRSVRPITNADVLAWANENSKSFNSQKYKEEGFLERNTRSDFGMTNEKIKVFTGETVYYDVQDLLLGERTQRTAVRAFEEFLAKAFFPGEQVELIPKRPSRRSGNQKNEPIVSVRINDIERKIYDLGDGIQAIIAILFPIFTRPNPDQYWIVGIEEPELNLHPGYQQILLRELSKMDRVQIFATTQSNHFIDAALDLDEVSVFSFDSESNAEHRRTKSFIRVSHARDRMLLSELGARYSSMLLSNCLIWVEGISDRRVFQHYLELFQQTIKEDERFIQDLHYTFFEYQGSNITHYDVLEETDDPILTSSLCAPFLVIADGDNAKGRKAERLRDLSDNLRGRFIQIEARELENLLTPEVIGRILTESEGGREIEVLHSQSFYKKLKLGPFLDSLTGDNRKKKHSTISGNLTDKAGFSLRVKRHTKTFADLSQEAKEITLKIYQFIKDNN